MRAAADAESQPASRIGIESRTMLTDQATSETSANGTPGPEKRGRPRPRPKVRPISAIPAVAAAAPRSWIAAGRSPRKTIARTDARPPYTATVGLTTETGPSRSAV